MDKKKLGLLLRYSYKDGLLDGKRVLEIAKLLKRSELKKYIRALKNYENKNTVNVITPFQERKINEIEKMFKDKKIIYQQDPSLLVGLKIISNDDVYELSLKDVLSKMANFVTKIYD